MYDKPSDGYKIFMDDFIINQYDNLCLSVVPVCYCQGNNNRLYYESSLINVSPPTDLGVLVILF